MPAQRTSRRAYGSGSLNPKTLPTGRTVWIASWRSGGRQIKRTLGRARPPGGRDGSDASAQAEDPLRQQGDRATAAAPPHARGESHRASPRSERRYSPHAAPPGRKTPRRSGTWSARSGSISRRSFGSARRWRDRAEDIADLMRLLEARAGPEDRAQHRWGRVGAVRLRRRPAAPLGRRQRASGRAPRRPRRRDPLPGPRRARPVIAHAPGGLFHGSTSRSGGRRR